MESKKKRVKISAEEFSLRVLPMLEQNLEVTITITGNSMFPLWEHGRDSVVITSYDKANLKKGDIPLYKRSNGQYVMHRIIRVNSESYDMCGDAQWNIEHNVSKKNVIAVVKAFTRKGKKYSCKNIFYRVYSALWLHLLPLRKGNIKVFRKLNSIFR